MPHSPLRLPDHEAVVCDALDLEEGVAFLDHPPPDALAIRDEHRVPIREDEDIVTVRRKGRELAQELGFSATDLMLIATAISELARNIVLYARTGEITLRPVLDRGKHGIVVAAMDDGPGIDDVHRALRGGSSTSETLGLGLPGVRRLMDDLEIQSTLGEGTIVVARKWK